jgi:fermentation-respiration switch protein FrsA (DUF1100 family)
MPGIWKLLLIGIGVYAAISIYAYYMQSSLIYYPNMPGRKLVATPADIGLSYQDVEVVTDDDIKLHGWFIPGNNAEATVLFFHGNAGNISHRLESIDIFNRLGLNVFIFDYRGYGQSEGKVTEKGTYRDAEAAWNYLKNMPDIGEQPVVIFGRSLGAAIATWLSSKHRPAALIVESGFTSIVSMAQRIYPFLPVRWLAHFKYDTRRYIKDISSPVLVAHSSSDEIIPYEEGREIFDAAPEPKRFLEMRGGHNDGFMVSGSDYVEGLRSFIEDTIRSDLQDQHRAVR